MIIEYLLLEIIIWQAFSSSLFYCHVHSSSVSTESVIGLRGFCFHSFIFIAASLGLNLQICILSTCLKYKVDKGFLNVWQTFQFAGEPQASLPAAAPHCWHGRQSLSGLLVTPPPQGPWLRQARTPACAGDLAVTGLQSRCSVELLSWSAGLLTRVSAYTQPPGSCWCVLLKQVLKPSPCTAGKDVRIHL